MAGAAGNVRYPEQIGNIALPVQIVPGCADRTVLPDAYRKIRTAGDAGDPVPGIRIALPGTVVAGAADVTVQCQGNGMCRPAGEQTALQIRLPVFHRLPPFFLPIV